VHGGLTLQHQQFPLGGNAIDSHGIHLLHGKKFNLKWSS
jgi:hypothetical protein